MTLVLPPELRGKTNVVNQNEAWNCYLPTQEANNSGNAELLLKPGSTYKGFWAPAPETLKTAQNFVNNIWYVFLSEMNFVFFSPGDYKIATDIRYYTDPQYPEADYRTATQSITVHVVAPQFVILFGAAVGGLVAYIVLPQGRDRFVRKAAFTSLRLHRTLLIFRRLFNEVTGVICSILLSAIITILLARISETQFLIRVTVNDFWGAVAVGFVANYLGANLLAKIIPVSTTVDSAAPANKPTTIIQPP
jgi:hypothetical protein